MTLNLHKCLLALVAAVSLGIGGCAADRSEPSRSTGQFVDDAALTARVKTAIATDVGAASAAAINVQTYRGEVQLNGFVDSQEHAKQAASAARDVEGVRTVQNNLQVKSSAAGR